MRPKPAARIPGASALVHWMAGAHVERHQVVEVFEFRVFQQRRAHGAHVVDEPRDGAVPPAPAPAPLLWPWNRPRSTATKASTGSTGSTRSKTTTWQPSARSLAAVARPIPRAPPVMSAWSAVARPPLRSGVVALLRRRPRADGGVDLGHDLLGQQ